MKTRKSITYLFRGLALGALMIAATGIYFGTTSSGAGDDPSLRGNQVGIAYPSSENSQGLQAPAYWVQRDEAEEMLFDELSKNFIGVPAAGNEVIAETHADRLPEILEEDMEERVYDELRMSFVGIPAPRSEATDRLLPVSGDQAGTQFSGVGTAEVAIPSYEQQRAADRHQENMDILSGTQFSGVGTAEVVADSYEQQRTADSIQERQEVRRILEDTGGHASASTVEHVACETSEYPLRHESFDEAWQNLLGRPPSSEPTACEIYKYASRNELEEMLFNEIWNTVGSKFNVNQSDPDLLQDVTNFFGEDVVAILGYKVLIARLNQYAADGHLSSTDMEHLDHEIDMMLLAAESGQ